MKTGTRFVLVVAVLILACSGYSNAEVLGTISQSGTAQGGPNPSGERFSISYPLAANYYFSEETRLSYWDKSISISWNITSDDIGKTFHASAETHASFNIFTFLLTNSVDNSLFLFTNHSIFAVGGSVPTTGFERELIDGVNTGVDFAGYSIDSISLTLNELSFINAGLQESMEYDITYTIYGSQLAAVPEPATLALLSLGSVVLLRRGSAQVLRRPKIANGKL